MKSESDTDALPRVTKLRPFKKKKTSHVTVCANHGPTQMDTFKAVKWLHMFKINAAH